MKKTLLRTFILLGILTSAYSQECGGTFTDPAGANTDYANNTDNTVTICPVNVGEQITVTFTAFNTETTWDALYVFDGNTIASPQIASGNPAGNVPGGLAGGFWGTTIPGPFTSSSQDGCLTFRFRSDAVGVRAGWIATVTCGLPPTCLKPTNPVVTGITAATATVGWTENNAATSWEVFALPCNSPMPTATSVGEIVTTNPYFITGLNPETCYSFYVRAICSSTDKSIVCVFSPITTSVPPAACGGQFLDNGGPNFYPNSSDVTTTICPTVAGEVVSVTFVSFDTETNYDALYVFDGATISAPQIASANGANNVPGGLAGGFWGTAIPGPFTSTSVDGCLTFRFRTDTTVNRAGWVANVNCSPPPTCRVPTTLTTSNITVTSAVANWIQPTNPDSSVASAWQILVLPAGSLAPTADTTGFVNATSRPFVITTLTPNTCYTIYVRAVCSPTDLSSWSAGSNFCTLISPPVCGGQFVDNGGGSNYINNSDNTYIICPTNPGEIVSVVFNSFDTETNWDALYVFDGNSIAAPQIASSNAAGNVPGGLAGGFWGTAIPGPFVSTSPDGCLTFRFRSDNTVNRAGWIASVICAADADKILLVAYVDQNTNGIKDTGEPLFLHGSFIYQQNNGINVNGYSPTGQYALYDTNPANTYNFSYQIQTGYTPYYSSATTAYSNISIPVGSGTQFLYFPMTLTQTYNDVSISLSPVTVPRPGFTYVNKITYKNQGIAPTGGTITFVKPPQITTYTVSQAGTVTNTTGFTYTFTNLLPNETRTFNVTMTVPLIPVVTINGLLTDSVSISAPSGDIDLTNNANTNSQIVVNSYDPNDKMESRGKTIPFNTFAQDDYFFYTIRFQNNGTANAIDVVIEDLLNSQINEATVLMVSSSHNYTMKRINNQLVWDFKNIYLAPASVNENSSKGFVQFKVQLNPGFQAGDIIPNNASIYFDSNPAIVTVTFNSKFTIPLGVADFDSDSLLLYPNPAHNTVQIDLVNTGEQLNKIVFYDLVGKTVKSVMTLDTNTLIVDVSDLAKGVYLVEISTVTNLKMTRKLIIQK